MNFDFATSQRIVFGSGKADLLPQLLPAGTRTLLWVTGKSPGRYAELKKNLTRQEIQLVPFLVEGEPSVDLVQLGAECCRDHQCSVVVAIGGGSVIDAGKAIAALATNHRPILEYLEVIGNARPLESPPLPFVAIPTTAGTGAEVTRNAVLFSAPHQVKVSLRHASMLPQVALVDPELSLSLPFDVTAATGLDALTQLIEPFLCTRRNPLVDALCREAIPRSARALPRALENPSDLKAREDLAFCSLMSGLALANAGLGAVHGFAAPIGGMFPSPHGAVCAALLPHVLKKNYERIGASSDAQELSERFRELSRMLTGRAESTAEDAMEWMDRFVQSSRIPPLKAYGLSEKNFPILCEKASAASSMKANPVRLETADLMEILRAATG